MPKYPHLSLESKITRRDFASLEKRSSCPPNLWSLKPGFLYLLVNGTCLVFLGLIIRPFLPAYNHVSVNVALIMSIILFGPILLVSVVTSFAQAVICIAFLLGAMSILLERNHCSENVTLHSLIVSAVTMAACKITPLQY